MTGFEAIGETGFGMARVAVSPGAHHIVSPEAPDIVPEAFGVMVEGLAPYTSYLYPGGLNLEPLDIEPDP